jgi:hypothetical protein
MCGANMKPTQDELNHAIIALAAEACAITDVRSETLHRLAELGLAHYENPGWALTKAGMRLLPQLMNGDGPPK